MAGKSKLPKKNIALAIRVDIFGMSQMDFADTIGSYQALISRWETVTGNIGAYKSMVKIREAADRLGLDFIDTDFFEVRDAKGK